MKSVLSRLVILLLLSGLLSACGQKGPLFLPGKVEPLGTPLSK